MKNKKYTKVLSIRLSEEERLLIENKSDRAGMKLSEYIRATALNRKITPNIPQIDRDTYMRLGKIVDELTFQKHMNYCINSKQLSELLTLLDQIRLSLLGISIDSNTSKNIKKAQSNDRKSS